MLANASRLSPVVLLLTTALAWADPGATVPPIVALKGVRPQAAAFKAGRPGEPLVIRSADDAAKHFAGKNLEAIRQKVDFKKQIVLLFAWRGSGQDRLTYSVAESYPEQVSFQYRPGRTRDLRPHAYVYALRSNVTWRAPKARARRPGGGAGKPAAPGKGPPAATQKHPRYREIHDAKIVVLATLDKAKAGPVATSYPPIYTFELTLTVGEVLRGPIQPKQQVRCSYSKSQVSQPVLPVGKTCLVLLQPRGEGAMTATGLEPATEELVKVARLAAGQARQAEDALAALARENPEKHPLFAPLQQARGVVVATSNLEGTASHDSSGTTTLSEICALSLKGPLKPGDRFEAVFGPQVAPGGKLPEGKFLILGFARAGGKYLVSCAAEASDANLRAAAAATGTPPRTRRDLKPAAPSPGKKDSAPASSGASPGHE